jgi:cobalamin biosynthetic protein CobC
VLRQVAYPLLEAAVGDSDVMVVCNPNNPTGACVEPDRLHRWAMQLASRGGWLVVDEAFGDTAPELSVAQRSNMAGLVVLHSIGKFFGLAGARLGFVSAHEALLGQLADMLGPWSVSAPAQKLARTALEDRDWQRATMVRLAEEGTRLRCLLADHSIASSGTPLFQWWQESQPEHFWQHMAERGIWVRLFTHAARGIRLGLPSDEQAWRRLETALNEWNDR